MNGKFSISDAIAYGFKKFFSNILVLVSAYLTFWGIQILLAAFYLGVQGINILKYFLSLYPFWHSYFIDPFLYTFVQSVGWRVFFIMLATIPLSIGFYKLYLTIYYEKKASYNIIFEPYTNMRLIFNYIAGSILYFLGVFLFIVLSTGTFFLLNFLIGKLLPFFPIFLRFVISGLFALPFLFILLYYVIRYHFFYLVIIDQSENAWRALEISYDMTAGSVGKLVLYFLSMILIALLGKLTIIGSIITMPAWFISQVYVYRALISGK